MSVLATQLLRDEAGISVPQRRSVARALAVYLLVLVPLNYLVFALLGRLEWAWVAVPLIGVAGAVWIARWSQLDIGFARSRTEIDLIEIQAEYPRAHVSRYLAIYNSLSTTYQLDFQSRQAVAAPLGVSGKPSDDTRFEFRQAFDAGVTLAGVSIASNRTRMLHAEQMLPLDGPIHYAPSAGRIGNGSQWTLEDAWIVSREGDGARRSARLGRLSAGDSVEVRLVSGPAEFGDRLPMGIERMMARLASGEDLAAGEMRLVARCESILPGLQLQPAVSQTRQQAVVLVHLTRPPRPAPEADRNLRTDVPIAAPEYD